MGNALAELREAHGVTMAELQERLERQGFDIPLATLYSYERGSNARGCDLPIRLFPAIASAFGLKTRADWLPRW